MLMRPARGRPQPKSTPKPTPKSKDKTIVAVEPTKQEIVLTQKQSFELVRIGINVAVCNCGSMLTGANECFID